MQYVAISSATPDATILYTTDGSLPLGPEHADRANGEKYTDPILITSTTTLQAITCGGCYDDTYLSDSDVQSGVYTMNSSR